MSNTFLCPKGHESTGESKVRQSCPKCGENARRVYEDNDAEQDTTNSDGSETEAKEIEAVKFEQQTITDEKPEPDKEQEKITESKRTTKDKLRDQGPKRIKVRKRVDTEETTSTKAAGVTHRRVGKSKAFPVIKGKQRTHVGVTTKQDSRTAAADAETFGRKVISKYFRI
jgi:predicted  nucleic acid-binding Zn-ribbon protein